MSEFGAKRVFWQEIRNFRVVGSSWFFQTMLTIQYISWLLKKIQTFSTFRSPIDVDNRNLVVPYKRVGHWSRLNILYMSSKESIKMGPRHGRPSRTPSSMSTSAIWWSPTRELVIKVNFTYYTCLCLIYNKESIKVGPRRVRPFWNTGRQKRNRHTLHVASTCVPWV